MQCSKESLYSITLVGDRQHRLRHLDAERPRRLQVDGKLELAALSGYLRAKGRRRQ
jgi:predicted DNA-binding protein with PD1-like motif